MIDGALYSIGDDVGELPRDRAVGVSDADEEAPIFGPGGERKGLPRTVGDAQDRIRIAYLVPTGTPATVSVRA